MATIINDSFILGKQNTPLDARAVIDELSDAYSIQNPQLGGVFYCKSTGKRYQITSLKAKQVGPLQVSDAAVNTFVELPTYSQIQQLSARIDALASDSQIDTQPGAYQTFDTVYQNKAVFSGLRAPVGVVTSKNNYYPVVNSSVELDQNYTALDVSPYLAFDSDSSFSGTWTVFFASGYTEVNNTTVNQFNNYYIVNELPGSDSLSQYPDGSFFILE